MQTRVQAGCARAAGDRGRVALGGRAGGFTLVEMMVSLAVLTLALGVVGVVFSVTTKTASRAAAYSETQNWVRQFMLQLEADLDGCEPGRSVLMLVGREQAAALTADDLAAGKYFRVLTGDPEYAANEDPEFGTSPVHYSNPRADILGLFTRREAASVSPNPYADATETERYTKAQNRDLLVVYGHAAFDEPVFNGASEAYEYAGNLRHIDQTVNVDTRVLSRIPACRWHLGRRATILVPPVVLPGNTQILRGMAEYLARCEPYPYLQGSEYLPGDAAYLNLDLLVNSVLGPDYLGALARPYEFTDGNGWDVRIERSVNTLLYAFTGSSSYPMVPVHQHVATVLEEIPVDLRRNIGVHMLPGCVWFQVEFLMPEDPRNSLDYLANPRASDPSWRSDAARWTAVAPDQTYVFVPDTEENRALVAAQAQDMNYSSDRFWDFGRLDQSVDVPHDSEIDAVGNRRIRMWPYAIRVTVQVFDSRGRLEEPIIRSLVHRFE